MAKGKDAPVGFGGGAATGGVTSNGAADGGVTEEQYAEALRLLNSGNAAGAGKLVARWSDRDQQAFFRDVDYAGNADSVQQAVQRERQLAFKNGEILPGMDESGGGTGLSPDAIQGILTSNAQTEAENLQGQQPGLDAYQQDLITDPGAGSFLDKLKAEGAWYDESVDGMNLTDYEAAQQHRTDTTGRDAQEKSLAAYDDVINSEGLTDIDRARVEQLRQDTARRARGQEEAIMADAAERGRAGGNASLLLRNQAQQSATNTRALGDMQTAAMGLERKDQAIRNRGFLGGDVQASDDAIDKFNTQNTQATLDNNAAAKNRAEAARWGQEQDNTNENVDVRQGAVGVDHDNDTTRSAQNTDRQIANEAGNDAGERAHYGDMWSSFGNKYDVTQTGPAYDAGDKSTPGTPGDNGIAAAGQGAIGGASAGASLGPYGAVIGGIAGGAAGFLGGRKKRERGSNGAW